jgi:streptogramin lyase
MWDPILGTRVDWGGVSSYLNALSGGVSKVGHPTVADSHPVMVGDDLQEWVLHHGVG